MTVGVGGYYDLKLIFIEVKHLELLSRLTQSFVDNFADYHDGWWPVVENLEDGS